MAVVFAIPIIMKYNGKREKPQNKRDNELRVLHILPVAHFYYQFDPIGFISPAL